MKLWCITDSKLQLKTSSLQVFFSKLVKRACHELNGKWLLSCCHVSCQLYYSYSASEKKLNIHIEPK